MIENGLCRTETWSCSFLINDSITLRSKRRQLLPHRYCNLWPLLKLQRLHMTLEHLWRNSIFNQFKFWRSISTKMKFGLQKIGQIWNYLQIHIVLSNFRLQQLNYSYIKNKWFFFLETLLCLVYTFWVQYHQKVGPWEVQKMSDTVELLHETDLVRSEKRNENVLSQRLHWKIVEITYRDIRGVWFHVRS